MNFKQRYKTSIIFPLMLYTFITYLISCQQCFPHIIQAHSIQVYVDKGEFLTMELTTNNLLHGQTLIISHSNHLSWPVAVVGTEFHLKQDLHLLQLNKQIQISYTHARNKYYHEGDEGSPSAASNKGGDDAGGKAPMDVDELGTPPMNPSMVNGVVAGSVVIGAPPRPRERGGGDNPTPRPPPRPTTATAAAAAPRPRVWLGVLSAAPKAKGFDPSFLRAEPPVDITSHCTPASSTATRRERRRGGQSRCGAGRMRPSGVLGGERRRRGKELAGKKEAHRAREKEARGIGCARRCETIPSYSASMGVGSASGNGMGASPPEATRVPSVSGGGMVFAKCPVYRRSVSMGCTCP
jgi:hypothetical protein